MRTHFKSLVIGAILLGANLGANAFSLLGPFTSWQIPALNNPSPFTRVQREGDLGGPMNLGEEYRWGAPVVVYGFDSSFVEYFGPDGVAAVEAAIKILNDLPAASNMTPGLREFPLNTTRFNYTAQQLRLYDLKSFALSAMLQNIGLACPERFTWVLYQQRPIPNTTPQQYTYSIAQRNFDPVSWKPSAYVNNTLYTYQIVQVSANPDTWDCQELTVDVANPNVSVIATAGLQAGVTDPRVEQQVYGPLDLVNSGNGLFYTGLTRDDVGAIRYMYRTGNTNWQAAPAGATSGFGSSGVFGSSPYEVAPFIVSNPDQNSPYLVAGGDLSGLTNITGGGIISTATAAPAGGRGGPGKLSFVRIDTDPLLGAYPVPVTIQYPQVVISTNGFRSQQTTSRSITVPDVLFTAGDIGADANAGIPYVYSVLGTTYTYSQNPSTTLVQDGPGIQEPGIQVIFNKVGPWIFNIRNTDQTVGARGFVWGSFDGSTNAPIVYPVGSTLQDVESLLFP